MTVLGTLVSRVGGRGTQWFASVFAASVAIISSSGCVDEEVQTDAQQQLARVCAAGPTVKGIDVSKYQGAIDWMKVKNDGVAFAFVRVSDGVNSIDPQFGANWTGAKAAGLLRGAYQYFRPNQDAAAQAELFLDKIGALGPGDLAPVLDVETLGGQSAAVTRQKVRQWIDIVETRTKRKVILYTGYYFWRDEVGNMALPDQPLWIAGYTSQCPLIPEVWDKWTFWQYSDAGAVNGISGGVDVNWFNGDLATLMQTTGGAAGCGDGVCTNGETVATCAVDCPPCGVISAQGGTIDDGDACFVGGGDPKYLRKVSGVGHDGDLIWTYATDRASMYSYGKWDLHFAEAGRYRVEVYTDGSYGKTQVAGYEVMAGGAAQTTAVNQNAEHGWQTLGEFEFAAGGGQHVLLGDNTGDKADAQVSLVLDAVRVTRVGVGLVADGDGNAQAQDVGGCAVAGSPRAPTRGGGVLWLFALLLAGRRRRGRGTQIISGSLLR